MKSIAFPNMFTKTKTNTVNDLEATKQNVKALLSSEKGEFIFDPYFGIRLKRWLFEQNNTILKDIIIDEVYTQVALFIPQVKVQRRDITLVADKQKGKITCHFKGINQIDFSVETYDLVLYNADNQL